MTEQKKTPAKRTRKPRAKATEKPAVEIGVDLAPTPEPKKVIFTYPGDEGVKQLLGAGSEEVASFVKKFQTRYGVKLHYIAKFKAFKLFKQSKHVDWITLNELMKRYDCRIPPVKETIPVQRPYKKDRIY